jgi:hypothetical protein
MEQVNIRLLEPSTKRQQTSNGSDVFKFVMNCVYYGDQVRPDFVTLQYASLDLLVGDAEGRNRLGGSRCALFVCQLFKNRSTAAAECEGPHDALAAIRKPRSANTNVRKW